MMRTPGTPERILDANLNRLAEGLRVIEDLVRFGLDDAALAGQLKSLRHRAGTLRGRLPGDLLAARDSVSDVGRVKVKEPARRADCAAVLAAAFGRVRESLRTIEELAKLLDPAAAAEAKAMRYAVYTLQTAIEPRFDRRARAAQLSGLYLVLTDPAVGYEALTEAAVRAGVAAIQLRDKTLESGPLLALARRLRGLTAGTRTLFIVNDRPDIAALSDADGVHVGQHDLTVSEVRSIVGDRLLVGKSTHNRKELIAALREEPDYVGMGPLFGTHSKANPDPMLGLERATRMLARAGGTPAIAIGGITRENLPAVLGLGFQGYALIGAVGASARPLATIRQLQKIERACGRTRPSKASTA